MSDKSVLQPSYWRQRAKEAREAAKDIINPANRKILEDVAKSYDDMADLMEPTWRIMSVDQRATAAGPSVKPPQSVVRARRTCSATHR
jgi:hypothetical protein